MISSDETELNQVLGELACEVMGYAALPFERLPGVGKEPLLSDLIGPRLMRSMLFSRAKSIWGGSNEIQHNVITNMCWACEYAGLAAHLLGPPTLGILVKQRR